MRKVLPLAAVCVLLCAPPAFGTGGSSDSKKLRDAVERQGHAGARGSAATRSASWPTATGWRARRDIDASSLYVGVTAALGGLKVSKLEFDYDLDLLADFKQPVLKVTTRGKRRSFNPGIGGAQFAFGGDFGSNYSTQSTDITAPVWAADVRYPAGPTPNGNTSGCEADDYAGMPAGAIVDRAARHLPVRAEVRARRRRSGAGAMLFSNEGNPGVPGRELPLWFDVTGLATPSGGGHDRDRHGAGQRRPEGPDRPDRPLPDGLAAGHLPDAERHRGDPQRRPEQRDRGRRAPRQRGHRLGHQRQRLRLGGAARAGAAHQQDEAAQQGALHLVQRRGVRPAGLGGLRREPARQRAGQDRGDAELRHDRVAELRPLRLRRRPVGLPAATAARRPARRRSSTCSSTTSRTRGSRTSRQRSTAAPTTGRSSRPASRPAACSPAPRGSRRRRRSRSTAARPASRSTSATTRAATTSST